MTHGAYVGSIHAVRDFRAALVTFAQEAREAIDSYEMEVRRTLDWLLEAQPQYWKHEVRKCEDRVTEAKIELERCRNSKLPGGETPSCMEERKALERARQRRQYAEEKVESVRKWGYVAQREEAEYAGRANQLSGIFDADLPQAISEIDRVLTALESYMALNYQGAEPPLTTRAAPALATGPMPPPVERPIAPEGVPTDAETPESPGRIDRHTRGPAEFLSMKPGDVMTGSAKLDKAWKKLSARWEATKLEWHDSVSGEFEERYLATLEPQIIATLQRMRSLAGVLTAAQHECDH